MTRAFEGNGKFLVCAAARGLKADQVIKLSDEEAMDLFRQIRWSATGGEAVCPWCDSADTYSYKSRDIWKCKICKKQFSMTTGTVFSGRKLPMQTLLASIA